MPKSDKDKTPPDALLSELQECNEASFKHRMEEVLDLLPPSERASLVAVLARMREKNLNATSRANSTYSYKWLSGVLTKYGHDISANQIRHYLTYIYPNKKEVS